ncbi:polysaccharide biosynthesis/export family protein [Rubellicoccus peritrichatus]|uniref:Polysaccharide biosynthesis/export family protein n=1 Tax=Rubellicoccus peritrichatus TaxID=3080537 RepID=A0AAQ3LCE5_9BACT|nr:polysaccharide biosynthesis/export family protein [Puniceicoccus sp. CR14]WOO41305.1 polysaccharide biosynthesis/export family protein [Puniceicoccus sp. CR14]
MNKLPLCLLLLPVIFIQIVSAQSGNSSSGGYASDDFLGNYIIQPLDIFRVSVFQEPDLEIEVRVAKDGSVVLPLLGKVQVGGMTASDVQQMITNLYNRDYLVDPHVTLMMLQYTERLIQVHGQVNRPGPVLIPPEKKMTLSQALSAAGGLTRLADAGDIRLKRVLDSGKSKVIRIDFDEILKDPEAKDVEVLDGDNIFVSERIF